MYQVKSVPSAKYLHQVNISFFLFSNKHPYGNSFTKQHIETVHINLEGNIQTLREELQWIYSWESKADDSNTCFHRFVKMITMFIALKRTQ